MNRNLDRKKLLVIGTMHAAQDVNHLKQRIKNLKLKKFSSDFVKNEEISLLKMREKMLNLIAKFKPEIIIEESGPYKKVPGDTWKAITKSKFTILEKKYKDKHIFADAKLLKSGKKPSYEKREKSIVNIVKKSLKQKNIDKVVLVAGAYHLDNIISLLKKENFSMKTVNLKKRFFGNIERLLKKERKLKKNLV